MMIINIICILLLITYPIAWSSPILKTSYLGLIYFEEITLINLIETLWVEDWVLCFILIFFSIMAPIVKIIYFLLYNFWVNKIRFRFLLLLLNKLSMTEIFVISIYFVLFKDIWIKELDVAWGLYLYTLCGLVSLSLSFFIEIKSLNKN